MKNFKPYYGVDGREIPMETTVSLREFTGRLTPKRHKIISSYARKLTNKAPYGYSTSGYAYRCGCEHDCCGCLTSEHGAVVFEKHWKGHKVQVFFTQHRNY